MERNVNKLTEGRVRAVVFDLDDTLVVDEAATRAAWGAVARAAARHGAEERAFAVAGPRLAAELWAGNPLREFCERVGVNDAECLWGSFGDGVTEFAALGEWAERYRREVMERAFAEQGMEVPEGVIEDLLVVFREVRLREGRLMGDALEVLVRMRGRGWLLGLLTNGAPSVQNTKIDAVGLRGLFDAIVISGEMGVGKPEREVFEAVLGRLGVGAAGAVMVGNSVARDVVGARGVGMRAVLLRVPGAEEPGDAEPEGVARSLLEVLELVERMDGGG